MDAKVKTKKSKKSSGPFKTPHSNQLIEGRTIHSPTEPGTKKATEVVSEAAVNAEASDMSTTGTLTRIDPQVNIIDPQVNIVETSENMTRKSTVDPEPGDHLVTPSEGIALRDACKKLGLSPGTFRRLLREYEGVPGLPGVEVWGQNSKIKKGLIRISDNEMEVLREIVRLRQRGKSVSEIKEILLKGDNRSTGTAQKDPGTVHNVDNDAFNNLSDEGFKGIAEAAATSEAVRERPETEGAQYTHAALVTVSESTQMGLDLDVVNPANWKLNLKEYTDVSQNDLMAHLDHLARALNRSEERRARDRDRLLTALMRTQQEIQQLRYELIGQRSRRQRKRGFLVRLLG